MLILTIELLIDFIGETGVMCAMFGLAYLLTVVSELVVEYKEGD